MKKGQNWSLRQFLTFFALLTNSLIGTIVLRLNVGEPCRKNVSVRFSSCRALSRIVTLTIGLLGPNRLQPRRKKPNGQLHGRSEGYGNSPGSDQRFRAYLKPNSAPLPNAFI